MPSKLHQKVGKADEDRCTQLSLFKAYTEAAYTPEITRVGFLPSSSFRGCTGKDFHPGEARTWLGRIR